MPNTWEPLRIKAFRALWIAGLISNLGSAVHGVAAGWLITDLDSSPGTVVLLTAATALPAFLLALPSGALADVFDRRRLLMVSQVIMAGAALALAGLTAADKVDIGWLLVMSVVLSVGGVLNMPNWVALTPELVPREQLTAAGATNAVSMNLAGALGPALGGVVVGALGPEWAFGLNALSFAVVLTVVALWRRDTPAPVLPPEHVLAAVRTGLRYALNDPGLGLLVVRIVVLAVGVTALGSLLPVVARVVIGMGAGGFGVVSATMGTSSVATSLVLPSLRARFGPDKVALAGGLVLAAGLVVTSQARSVAVLCVAVALVAAGQSAAFSSTFATVQAVLPGWVRGRGLAIAMLSFQGATFAGAIGWGAVADAQGTDTALALAGGVTAVGALAVWPISLARRASVDVAPLHANPHTHHDVDERTGPVLVTARWRIDPHRADDFAAAMTAMRRLRRRSGALQWGLYRDVDDPGHFIEVYSVASWLEHERQHARPIASDGLVHATARGFLLEGSEPDVSHHLAAHAPPRNRHWPVVHHPDLH